MVHSYYVSSATAAYLPKYYGFYQNSFLPENQRGNLAHTLDLKVLIMSDTPKINEVNKSECMVFNF